MKQFYLLVLLPLLWAVPVALAQSAEDQYVNIYNVIQEGDRLAESNPNGALLKYEEARQALGKFQKAYSNWNPAIVNFRVSYLTRKITALKDQPGVVGPRPAATQEVTSELPAQVSALQEQLRQLQADNASLQAKLREALAARPASIDPLELASTRERLRQVQKENDLLQVALDKSRSNPGAEDTGATLSELQAALNDARVRAALRDREYQDVLEQKHQLERRLQDASPDQSSGNPSEALRKELAAANERIQVLSQERDQLKAREVAATEATDVAALRAENELLKRQLQAAANAAGQNSAPRDQAELAALRSELEVLRQERTALQARVQQLTAVSKPVVAQEVENPRKLRQYEKERLKLEQELAEARKKLASRRTRAEEVQFEEFNRENLELKARLQAYEARAVAFTPEELAMFRASTGPVSGAGANPRQANVNVSELRETGEKLLRDGKYVEAEVKFQELLRNDPANTLAVANLALALMQQGKSSEAERQVRRGLAVAPQDAALLAMLGQIHFREKRYEEALKALGRAAQLEPQNPEILNHLGLALGARGLRGPAETTLRQALQIRPGYGLAHYNLAVLYISQKPPMTELAKYHYGRATQAGINRNSELEKLIESAVHLGPVE